MITKQLDSSRPCKPEPVALEPLTGGTTEEGRSLTWEQKQEPNLIGSIQITADWLVG